MQVPHPNPRTLAKSVRTLNSGISQQQSRTHRAPGLVVVLVDDCAKISTALLCVDELTGELVGEVHVVAAAAPLPALVADAFVAVVTATMAHALVRTGARNLIRYSCSRDGVGEGSLPTSWQENVEDE